MMKVGIAINLCCSPMSDSRLLTQVCKDSFAEEHEMNDDNRSLEDYGT